MRLQTIIGHMKNTSILVNGTMYAIDAEGYAEVEKKEDADKLLCGKSWIDPSGRAPVPVPPKAPQLTKAPQPIKALQPLKSADSGMKLIDSDGDIILGQVSAEDVGDPSIPEDSNAEWPDPKESYSLEWLKRCADAYGVKYGRRIGKSKLIDRINKAMYD